MLAEHRDDLPRELGEETRRPRERDGYTREDQVGRPSSASDVDADVVSDADASLERPQRPPRTRAPRSFSGSAPDSAGRQRPGRACSHASRADHARRRR